MKVAKRSQARLPGRFWLYFGGQSLSNLGSAFTGVAVPLLVFRLTGSATDLGAATAVNTLPWIFFGFLGGAVMDRVDRKRLLVVTELGQGVVVAVLPLLAAVGALRLGWIYGVLFATTCLQLVSSGGLFSAVAALVEPDQLVPANAWLSGSFSASSVAGTALAGVFFAVAPIPDALWIDAVSFGISAATLAAIRRSFNAEPPPGLRVASMVQDLVTDMKVGLRYVWHHPVLRPLTWQLAIVNFFGSAAISEVALFAIRRLGANNSEVGYLQTAGSAGVVVLSVTVGPLRRRLSLATMILVALTSYGIGIAAFGVAHTYGVALLLWAWVGAATVLYNVSTTSMRQRIVPNELMGRVWNVALTFSRCSIPLGSITAGAVISATGRVVPIYVVAGLAIALVAVVFNRTSLRHAAGTE